MRLIDADELIEHAWRDKLDSRERIAEMIENAPTIKVIPTKIPIDIFEQLVSQAPKMGHWIDTDNYYRRWKCSECGYHTRDEEPNYCPNCGAEMRGTECL